MSLKLYLSNCHNIKDFSYIKNCKKIEILFLDDTNVDDISFLENNINITYLVLSDSKNIKDYSYIKNCEKLDILGIIRSNIDDISFLEQTNKIK